MRYTYVVLRDLSNNTFELERMSEDKWEEAKQKINIRRLYRSIAEENSPELDKFDFKTVVWDRVYDKTAKNNVKVIIPFIPDDLEAMEKAGEKRKLEIIEELKNKQLERANKKKAKREKSDAQFAAHRKASEAFIKDAKDLKEALMYWYETGMNFPAPQIIKQEKNKSKLTWTEFKDTLTTAIENSQLDYFMKQINLGF